MGLTREQREELGRAMQDALGKQCPWHALYPHVREAYRANGEAMARTVAEMCAAIAEADSGPKGDAHAVSQRIAEAIRAHFAETNEPEAVGLCEDCEVPVRAGTDYLSDNENGLVVCPECAPKWLEEADNAGGRAE